MQTITPCLWFDGRGEEAARFYASIFPDSRIVEVVGPTVVFELRGQRFTALDGGPEFTFGEAISFQVACETQEEVDRYWDALSEGGEEGPCGWLKDRFGLSWQIVPNALPRLLADPDPERARRAGEAMRGMKKIEIAELERAVAAA